MIKVLGKRVLLEPIKEDTSIGGIITTNTSENVYNESKVIAIGETVENIKLDDVVLYQEFSCNKINLDGKEYLIIHEDDILAIK